MWRRERDTASGAAGHFRHFAGHNVGHRRSHSPRHGDGAAYRRHVPDGAIRPREAYDAQEIGCSRGRWRVEVHALTEISEPGVERRSAGRRAGGDGRTRRRWRSRPRLLDRGAGLRHHRTKRDAQQPDPRVVRLCEDELAGAVPSLPALTEVQFAGPIASGARLVPCSHGADAIGHTFAIADAEQCSGRNVSGGRSRAG